MAAWPKPPVAGRSFHSVEFQKQYDYAIRERYAAADFKTWPRAAWVYDFGVITAITSTSVTIGGKTWSTTPVRWVGYDNTTGGGWEATNYDLIIDDCDPRKVIRSRITAQPAADTVTIDDITQRVTERVTPSLAALVGRIGVIVKRGGIWWSDRWMEEPNAEVYAQGVVATAAAGTLTALDGVSSHALVGKDVLFFNNSFVLQRGTITVRADKTLTFTGTAGTADIGGAFYVVAAGDLYVWGKTEGRPNSAYRGTMDAYYTHYPDDSLGLVPKPAATRDFKFGTVPGSCPAFPTAYPVHDIDMFIAQDEICDSDNDFTFAPDLYKTLRGRWDALFDVCDKFVHDISYDHAGSIPVFCHATWLAAAGINSATVTAGTHTGTGLPVAAITVPFVPHPVWFAVIGDDGSPQNFGVSDYDGTEIHGSFTSDDDGKAVVVSLGPTRWVPRHFRRWLDVEGFIPDVDTGAAVWPPTEDFPGSYIVRPASTHYNETTDLDNVLEATRAEDVFADGDLARYVGENWDDPTTDDSAVGGIDPQTPYKDRLFTGRRGRIAQNRLAEAMRGTATGGSTTQLVDLGKNWWACDFWSGSVFTRTGTATSGSTTTLADGAAGGAFWNDTVRNQTGLTVSITHAGIEYRRMITAHVGGTLTFDALPVAVVAGDAYAIRETDGVKNRWKGATLTVRKLDTGTGLMVSATVTISGNDDVTLFFPAISFAVDDTTLYEIKTVPTGGVWLRYSGTWIKPTGNDLRDPFPPFRQEQTGNLPTMVKRYGLPRLRDYAVMVNWAELKAGISALKVTQQDAAWDPRANDAVSEMNEKDGGDSLQGSLAADKLSAQTIYAADVLGYDDPDPPHARTELDSDGFGDGDAEASRSYSYLVTTFHGPGFCPVTWSSYDFYVYGWIDVLDSAPGGTDPVYNFDANGDTVDWHAWRLFDTGSGSALTEKSARFGSLTFPNWPPTPGDPPAVTRAGYYIAATKVLVHWNFVYD